MFSLADQTLTTKTWIAFPVNKIIKKPDPKQTSSKFSVRFLVSLRSDMSEEPDVLEITSEISWERFC